MNPETHLLASWIIGAKATNNARDCRLVALAGILPDVDGLGLLVDAANRAVGGPRTLFYEHYHHSFVRVLRKWHGDLAARFRPGNHQGSSMEKESR